MSLRKRNEATVEDHCATQDLLAAVSDRAVVIASQLPDDASRVTVAAGAVRVEIDLGLRDQGRPAADAGTPGTPGALAGPASLAASGATAAPESSPGPADSATDAAESTKHVVRATGVGAFYRRPSPMEDEFVKEGDHVEVGDQIAIVEAMKLMIPVKSDASGTVIEFHVADGDPVEYEQPLMTLVREP